MLDWHRCAVLQFTKPIKCGWDILEILHTDIYTSVAFLCFQTEFSQHLCICGYSIKGKSFVVQ